MTESRNPFEHHHAHHHDDDHEAHAPMDPAQQSLADALRVSFMLLKIVMVILVIFYLFSGVFSVEQQTKVVVLHFGELVQETDSNGDPIGVRVYKPGGPYFRLPLPIDEVVSIPTTAQTIILNKQFYYEPPRGMEQRTHAQLAAESDGMGGSLNPEKDGSLLTGDANIVHARWQVTYELGGGDDTDKDTDSKMVADFVTNVGTVKRAEQMVTIAAEQAVVATAAQFTADQILQKDERVTTQLTANLQKLLDGRNTGITIQKASLVDSNFPITVTPSYNAVLDARNKSSTSINDARKEYEQVMTNAAGGAYAAVLELIDAYETAVELGDEQAMADTEAKLADAFASRTVEQRGQIVELGGIASQIINQAQETRTRLVASVEAELKEFLGLLPYLPADSNLPIEQRRVDEKALTFLMNRLWADAKQTIFSGEDIELGFMPAGQVYLELNRDPDVLRRREERRLQQEQEMRNRQRAGGF